MTSTNTLLVLYAGNSPGTGEFPAQRPVTRIFYVFFDLCLNKRLSKQSWGWFETPSRPLWRHWNGIISSRKATRIDNRTTECNVRQASVWNVLDIYYNGVIMNAMACQITVVSIACWTVCSGVDQRKHPSSVSLAFVRAIYRWPVDCPHKEASYAENVSIWRRQHAPISAKRV